MNRLENILYLPIFKDYYQINDTKIKVFTNKKLLAYTQPMNHVKKMTFFEIIDGDIYDKQCQVLATTKSTVDDMTLTNIERFTFTNVSRAIFCEHYIQINDLQGQLHFQLSPDSCLIKAGTNGTCFDFDILSIDGYKIMQTIDTFDMHNYKIITKKYLDKEQCMKSK